MRFCKTDLEIRRVPKKWDKGGASVAPGPTRSSVSPGNANRMPVPFSSQLETETGNWQHFHIGNIPPGPHYPRADAPYASAFYSLFCDLQQLVHEDAVLVVVGLDAVMDKHLLCEWQTRESQFFVICDEFAFGQRVNAKAFCTYNSGDRLCHRQNECRKHIRAYA